MNVSQSGADGNRANPSYAPVLSNNEQGLFYFYITPCSPTKKEQSATERQTFCYTEGKFGVERSLRRTGIAELWRPELKKFLVFWLSQKTHFKSSMICTWTSSHRLFWNLLSFSVPLKYYCYMKLPVGSCQTIFVSLHTNKLFKGTSRRRFWSRKHWALSIEPTKSP